jgi:hypothetical protein
LEGRDMAVDPGISPFLARVNRKPPPSKPVSLAQARRGVYRLAEIVAPQTEIAMYSVEDATIPGPGNGNSHPHLPTERRPSAHRCVLPPRRMDDRQYRQP